MNESQFIEPGVAEAVGWMLVHSCWQVVLIGGLLKVALAAISEQRSRLRYALACGSMVAVVVTMVSTLMMTVTERTSERVEASSDVAFVAEYTLIEPMGRPAAPQDVDADPGSVASPVLDAGDGRQPGWRDRVRSAFPVLLLAWLGGVSFFLGRVLLGVVAARRLCRVDVVSAPESLARAVEAAAARLRVTRPVRVVMSSVAQVPTAIGWLRPWIVLPVAAVTGLPARELESILLHELAHIRRYDALVNVVQSLVEAALFYHPVAWWISGRMRAEREHCCDDLVLQCVTDKSIYLGALARLERSRAPVVALSAVGGSLVQRVRRMTREEDHRGGVTGAWSLVVVAALATGGVLALSSPRAGANAAVGPTTAITLDQQRERNQAAYETNRDYLREVHGGRWVVIADGLVIASFESVEEAVAEADARRPQADHRFVFRPGVDDGDEEFIQSPWTNDDPSWFQIGRRVRAGFPLTISTEEWERNGKRLATPDGRGRITVASPSGDEEVSVQAVCSLLFDQDLTLTDFAAREARLDRYAVPGTAKYGRVACRKVLCRVKIAELDVDESAVAFVFPDEFVSSVEPFHKLLTSSESKGVAWGLPRDGLQAGVRLACEEARAGDVVAVEVVIRNLSAAPIAFTSSSWRQDDELTLRDGAGEELVVHRTLYTGNPDVRRYEVGSMQSVTLPCGSLGLREDEGAPRHEHPVVYDVVVSPGPHTVTLRLRFPDIDGSERGDDTTYRGELLTGAFDLAVRPD